jgi:hypothetical protein
MADDDQTAPPADDKIGLPDMILWVAGEITRQEAWEQVVTEEGKRLNPDVARRLAVSRKTLETLELLTEFQRPFVDMVKVARARQRAEMKSAPAPKRSATTTSPQDTDPTAAG